MYSRILRTDEGASCFLFGPRGTGKSSWVRATLPDATYLDLLDDELYTQLHASPHRLEALVPADSKSTVVIDEIQKVPALLDEVHRLIEERRLRFILTGSSARKLRQKGINLLAGRARVRFMHPLTAAELGRDFALPHALRYGCLPSAWTVRDPKAYLSGYIATYLKQEVLQEGLTRNLGAFSRFLEAAALSQAQPLNVSAVARECAVERKVVENYFSILEDLLLSVRLPVFTRRAQRGLVAHPKFFLFDAGVYRTLRPKGPLDPESEIAGPALETLVLQHLRATNDSLELDYGIHTWRTTSGLEVDFVLYGERGLHAIEVKSGARVRSEDLRGLRAFLADYPMAKACLLYAGKRAFREGAIDVLPAERALAGLASRL